LSYAAGALAGLILGCLIGYLKNLLIWQKYMRKCSSSEYSGQPGMGGLYARAFISYTANIVALVLAFFTRNLFPFSGVAYLVGAAVGLTVMNKVLVTKQKKAESAEKENC